jgi:acyl carrier protein
MDHSPQWQGRFGLIVPASLLSILLLDGLGAFTSIQFWRLRDSFLIFITLLAIHITACATVMRILILAFPIEQEGVFPLDSPQARRWTAQAAVATVSSILLHPLVPLFLLPLWYRLFGAKIGPGVNIAGQIIDCSLTEMGTSSSLGAGSTLLGHFIAKGKIHIQRVRLLEAAEVGAHSLICPGVTVETHAMVGAMSYVPPGRTIPGGEIWLGIPAVKAPRIDPAQQLSDEVAKPVACGDIDASANKIQEELRKFITELLAGACGEDELDERLMSGALLDSITLMQLLLHLEQEYKIRIPDEEVNLQHFGSVSLLAQFVHRKLRSAKPETLSVRQTHSFEEILRDPQALEQLLYHLEQHLRLCDEEVDAHHFNRLSPLADSVRRELQEIRVATPESNLWRQHAQ